MQKIPDFELGIGDTNGRAIGRIKLGAIRTTDKGLLRMSVQIGDVIYKVRFELADFSYVQHCSRNVRSTRFANIYCIQRQIRQQLVGKSISDLVAFLEKNSVMEDGNGDGTSADDREEDRDMGGESAA